ncbi:MAG: hypothetical protein P0S93_04630 [Candidatus Neptunochlamydia sp.]|nr:hypothetical protein [Candidatus Neptunochlamydia sp.]
MKKVLFFFLTSLFLYAAVPTIYIAPPAGNARAAVEGTQEEGKRASTQNNPLSEIAKAAASKETSGKRTTEMMIISPEGRAKDIQAAIKFLQQKAPTDKLTIKLTNGKTLTGIVSVDVMPGGTLLIFKIASLKGLKYQIENIENIDTIIANET